MLRTLMVIRGYKSEIQTRGDMLQSRRWLSLEGGLLDVVVLEHARGDD